MKARDILEAGGLVAIPTETVYGLAGNALNPQAVARIFEVKRRPYFDPLIVHTDSIDRAREFVLEMPPAFEALAEAFLPGPLTFLLPRKPVIPDLVTAGSERVAIRIPDHPLALELLSVLPFPLAAPSANPFGYISPTRAEHVAKQLGDQIGYILDGGPCGIGLESTIIGMEDGGPVIYRLGGLAIDAIEAVTGPVKIELNQSSDPKVPGQLKSHYAPHKPVYFGDLKTLLAQHAGKKIGILGFGKTIARSSEVLTVQLSERGDLYEAATRLFACLRELDDSDAEIILASPVPATGLGLAINDRLMRASA